ncbi:amino acid permease, partial [Candidatus Margulisiibacteriota bacterium]
KNIMKRFGTFEGVFTPTILSILGVIMFLRLGWVVGNVGLAAAVLIIVISNVITFSTALSMSSILTNIKVGAGGAYSIITKSLGLEAGLSVGIPLFLSQAISIAFYITGFTEVITSIFPVPHLIVSLIVWAVLLAVSVFSTKLAFRVQFFILAIIGGSLISVLLRGGEVQNPLLFAQGLGKVGFWGAFAVFFPAVTGVLAGASMSGELNKPEKAIPKGTLAAVGMGFFIYIGLAVWYAFSASAEALVANTTIVTELARWRWLVIGGVMGATLSSALSMFVSAPRTLLALGKRNILPLSGLFSKVNAKGEPVFAIICAAIISFITLMAGSLNAIATLLTMFFLITYAILNLALFIEQGIGIVSFRPTFKISLVFPLIGGIGCLFMMFLINPLFSVIAWIIIIAMYFYFLSRDIQSYIPDVRKGLFIYIAEKALEIADSLPNYPKIWKPNLLVMVHKPENLFKIVPLLECLSVNKGRIHFLSIIEQELHLDNVEEQNELKQEHSKILDEQSKYLKDKGALVSNSVITVSNFYDGANIANQIYNTIHLPLNVLFFKLGKTAKKDEEIENLAKLTSMNDYGLIFLNWHEEKVSSALLGHRNQDREAEEAKQKYINLWIRERSPNYNLAILVALQLKDSWDGIIRLIQVPEETGKTEQAGVYLRKLIKVMRMPRDTEVFISSKPFGQTVKNAPAAAINILGTVVDNIEVKALRNLAEKLDTTVLFIRDSKHAKAVS